jgi:hypothetical protein
MLCSWFQPITLLHLSQYAWQQPTHSTLPALYRVSFALSHNQTLVKSVKLHYRNIIKLRYSDIIIGRAAGAVFAERRVRKTEMLST